MHGNFSIFKPFHFENSSNGEKWFANSKPLAKSLLIFELAKRDFAELTLFLKPMPQ